jgi:raffinose/stachyose/melibiose transport system permease protein
LVLAVRDRRLIAYVNLVSVPLLVVLIAAQRKIISGITSGAVK